jgi:hypothetical protein
MPRYFRGITRYQLWKPAADRLAAAGYDFARLKREGLTRRLERPWLMRLLGDTDPNVTTKGLFL